MFFRKKAQLRISFLGKRTALISALLLTFVTQQGCSTHSSPLTDAELESGSLLDEEIALSDTLQAGDVEAAQKALNDFLSQWEGTPYRLGGNSHKSIDCSALSSRTYKELFDIDLPRTARDQAGQGTTIPQSELQPGDLIFFKTGRYQNHVGVYMGNNIFMHASSTNGVTVSEINSPYWQKRFWKATSHHKS